MILDQFRLTGKQALVTGASKGIGLGIARGLAEAGARIILIARDRTGLDTATRDLRAAGHNVSFYSFDLTSIGNIPAFYEKLLAEAGPVDVLVNNAGVTLRRPAEAVSEDDWDRLFTLNVKAAFVLSQAFARERMQARQPGRIINIASLMSELARPTTSVYAATKGAIRQLTRGLAIDWAPSGILVNAIAPGFIKTPLTVPLQEDPEFDSWIVKRTPLGRWGLPDDVAAAAVFLASEASSFITGQIVYVDGGWLASC